MRTSSNPFSVQVVAPGKAPAAWRKINVGVGGSDSWGSSGACVERGGKGRIFHYFNWMNIYDPVSNTWTKGGVRGRRENYGSDHDTDNDIIWMSPGGPAFEQNNSAFPPVTANSRTLRYNPATDTFTAHTSSLARFKACSRGAESARSLTSLAGLSREACRFTR